MKRTIYLFFAVIFFCVTAAYAAPPNTPPAFVNGASQSFSVCKNGSPVDISSMLAVNDPDVGQTETWSVVISAVHGVVVASYSTTSTGSTLTPTGLTYSPFFGYSGADSFTVLVSDGIATNLTTLHVSIDPAPIAGPAGVCTGSSITLTDVTPGGIWSTSSATAVVNPTTGVVTGITSGSAVITYSEGLCSTTTTIAVNAISPITGAASICPGNMLSLSDGTAGGSWSSSDMSVATVVSVGSFTGHVYGVSGGTATITYLMPSGCFATTVVTVNPNPAAIIGTISVCSGLLASLSDATPGGTWSSSNTAVATIIPSSGIYAGITGGLATIAYTLSTGCKSLLVITINPTPAPITGTAAFCSGTTTLLTDVTLSGTWSSSNTSIASVSSSGLVNGVSAGTATITYTLAAGCVATEVVTVRVAPTAISGPSGVCTGSSITLSDGVGGGVWSTASALVSVGASSGVVTGITSGAAVITYAVGSCSITKTITVSSLSPITGAASICPGALLTLHDASGGGSWTTSASAIASVVTSGSFTGLVYGISGGTATITYSTTSGCFATTSITIYPTPDPITGLFEVCSGYTAALADASGGGTWSSANTAVATIGTASGVYTGVSGGWANITYTSSAGCKVSQTVTVHPSPASIAGSASVCQGYTTALSDAVLGGAWVSSDDTIASVNPVTGLVTANNPGIVTIAYVLPVSCIVTRDVTVNVTPQPIAGPSTVCRGYSITLTDTVTGGLWTASNTYLTVGSISGVVNGLIPGTTIITYKVGNCSVTKPVSVNPISDISGSEPFCQGSLLTLHDGTVGGSWKSEDEHIATALAVGITSGLVTGVGAGTTTITYDMGNGCIATTIITVNPLPAPILGPTSICHFNTTTIYDSTAGGIWTSIDTIVAKIDDSTGFITAESPGTTIIFYTLPLTGCELHETFTIWDCPVSVPQVPVAGEVRISPNPGNGLFHISGSPGNAQDEDVRMVLTNMLGQIVFDGTTRTQGGNIDVELRVAPSVPAGNYVLSLRSDAGTYTFHIVLQR